MPPLTEVNKLSLKLQNLRGEQYKAMVERWGPRWASGLRVSMASGEKANRLNRNIKNIGERVYKANKNLDEALNRNTTSLKAQERNIQRKVTALYKNVEAASNALKNLNAKARHANNANEKARIEKNKIPYKVILKRFREQRPILNAERNRLFKEKFKIMNARKLREKILSRKMTENQARSVISRTLVPNVLYGPHGTRTINARRRFNAQTGRTGNYLENYMAAMRQINRLRKRKRNNNNL